MPGIVYCLTNPAMPDYVKIGRTTNLEQRLKQLDSTSVPLPFEVVYAIEVDIPEEVEKLLHDAFADHRTRSTREFFMIDALRIRSAMRLAGGRDVTPTEDIVEDAESQKALDQGRARRAAFNFQMVGLEPGAQLYFDTKYSNPAAELITATVASHNRIIFEGEETSLSTSALIIYERQGVAPKSRAVQGPTAWYYNGETLTERRHRMELEGVV